MANYPPLRMAVLNGLLEIKSDLASLDAEDCPYDPETVKVLKDILAPQVVEKVVEKEVVVQAGRGRGRPSKDVELSSEDKQLIGDTIRGLIEALDAMGTGEGLETNERIQITKTKTALVRDLLQLREKNVTAQKMEEFKETVIGILNDLVKEEDRELFLRRLEPYR